MAEGSDIRVKLSAEGVEEVVRALQKIQNESKKTGDKGAKGIGMMNEALGVMKSYLPTITFAGVVASLVGMAKQAFDTARALDALSQKTGFSVKTLSVFQSIVGASNMEVLEQGIIKFNNALGKVEKGSTETGNAFRALLGDFDAIKKLPLEQKFFKTAEALAKMPDGYKKTQIVLDLFSESGAKLIPFLNKVGTSFDEFKKKAEAAGLVIDEDFVKAAKAASKNLAEVKKGVQGLATQFTAGLAPALATAAEEFRKVTKSPDGSVNGLRKVGDIFGTLVKGIVFGFEVIGKAVGTQWAVWIEFAEGWYEIIKGIVTTASDGLGAIWDAMGQALSGNFSGASETLKKGMKAVTQDVSGTVRSEMEKVKRIFGMYGDFAKDVKADFGGMFGKKADKPGDDTEETTNNNDRDTAGAKAMIALQKARIDAALALNQKLLSQEEQKAKQAYDRGLKSMEDYYDERVAMTKKGAEEEIKALQKKRALALSGPSDNAAERTAKIQEAEGITSQIKQKQIDLEMKLADIQAERLDKLAEANRQNADIQRQILEVNGQTLQSTLSGINAQAEAMLKMPGIDKKSVEDLRKAQTDRAQFQFQQQQANLSLDTLDLQKAQIDSEQAAGKLYPFEAAEKYRQVVLSLLPSLQAQGQAMREAAVTPDEIMAAEMFNQKLDEMAIAVDKDAQQMATLKAGIESALSSDLTNFFTNGIDEAENFGDAMRGLALSVVDSLRQIAAQMLATYATQQLMKAFGGFGFSGGGLVKAATGGYITGPGTATSDSIPARLSNGEFVVRAGVVSKPGVLEHLIALNRGSGNLKSRGSVPRFAEGGLVTAQEALAGGMTLEADFGIEEGVIARKMKAFLRSPDGQRIQIDNLGQNRKRASNALGR